MQGACSARTWGLSDAWSSSWGAARGAERSMATWRSDRRRHRVSPRDRSTSAAVARSPRNKSRRQRSGSLRARNESPQRTCGVPFGCCGHAEEFGRPQGNSNLISGLGAGCGGSKPPLPNRGASSSPVDRSRGSRAWWCVRGVPLRGEDCIIKGHSDSWCRNHRLAALSFTCSVRMLQLERRPGPPAYDPVGCDGVTPSTQ